MSNFSDFKKKFASEINKDIPETIVELPSGLGKASIISMKVKEQKDFLKALEKQDEYLINEAFDKILSRCVLNVNGEPADVETLCVQDRNYLLLMIRKLIGTKAKISHICPKSEKVYNNIEIDLDSNLEVTPFSGIALSKTIEIVNGITLVVGPVSRKNDKEVEQWIKTKAKDKSSVIDRRYCGYAALIKEIWVKTDNGNEKQDFTFDNKVEFIIESCTPKILEQLDEYYKSLDFGVKVKFHFKSDEYENENEEAMLLSFFIM
jgi:hypothetical protein